MAKIAIVFVGLLALASVGQAVLNTDRCVAGVQQLLLYCFCMLNVV